MADTIFKVNTLYYHALYQTEHITETEQLRSTDMTQVFYDEMLNIIDSGELLNININGFVTIGKSTLAFAIADWVKTKRLGGRLNIHDVDRDQQEFSITIRNPNIKNTIRVIDEWNEMETGGENSTVESQFLSHFSDVQAQRFIHRISCSPDNSTDKNSNIFLEVVQADKQNYVTHAYLYYKIMSAGQTIRQLIGYVNIDVSNIIHEDWYKEYRRRKIEKWDLITKEGVYRPRELTYAKPIIEVITKLQPLTKLGILDKDTVRNHIEMTCRHYKIPLTILGTELITNRAKGVLSIYLSIYKLKVQQADLTKKFSQQKMTIEDFNDKNKIITEALSELTYIAQDALNELNRYQKIYEQFSTIIDAVP